MAAANSNFSLFEEEREAKNGKQYLDSLARVQLGSKLSSTQDAHGD